MRRGLRFLPPALLLAAVVEIAVFVLLGHAVGFATALLLVLVASLAGGLLLRREGVRAWRRFRTTAAAGQPPGDQVIDGLVGLAGALLLAVPGLVSGVLGLVLLVPPVRLLARGAARRLAERRVSSMVAADLFGPRRVRVHRGTPRPEPPRTQPATGAIEGEIV